MPVRERVFTIRQIPINASTWTDVQGRAFLPIDCNFLIIFNNTGVDIYLRTDPDNADSQITLSNGQQFEIGCCRTIANGQSTRFMVNMVEAVCALKSSSGNVSALVECLC